MQAFRAANHEDTLRFDYTTIGHVTADVLGDGTRRPGGSAFYSALQAARMGLRSCILTRGKPAEIEELLAPFRAELELEVEPASHTTTLLTTGAGAARRQSVLAWAGEIGEAQIDTAILHLAPVAREGPQRWLGQCAFVGLTPQGLAREWSGAEAEIALSAPAPEQEALAARCDALVLSEVERPYCEAMIERARHAGAVVAVTAGAGQKTLLLPDGTDLELPAEPVREAHDDLGAGDVFAAALFIAMYEGRDAPHAARFASAAAALRVERTGAVAIASRSAVEARLREGAANVARD